MLEISEKIRFARMHVDVAKEAIDKDWLDLIDYSIRAAERLILAAEKELDKKHEN